MYNKKTLSDILSKIDKAKAPAKKKDIIVDPRGQWAHPGEVTRIPGNDITMAGVPYPVYGVDNTGYGQMMYPGQNYTFPGDYVDEYPMAKKGGSLPKLPKKKNAKAYSKSLMATNRLFAQSWVTDKPKSKKNKIYDPKAKYYQEGGTPEDYQAFLDYSATAPENRRPSENYFYGSPDEYDHYGMWEALGKPKDFQQALEMNPDWEPDPYDGYYHGFSVNPNTGVFLKSGKPGLEPGDTTWMEIAGHYKGRDAQKYTPVFDPELQRFKYIPNEYIEIELTPEEIEEYKKGGYIVEDISVPELTKAQTGKVVKCPEGYSYDQVSKKCKPNETGNVRYVKDPNDPTYKEYQIRKALYDRSVKDLEWEKEAIRRGLLNPEKDLLQKIEGSKQYYRDSETGELVEQDPNNYNPIVKPIPNRQDYASLQELADSCPSCMGKNRVVTENYLFKNYKEDDLYNDYDLSSADDFLKSVPGYGWAIINDPYGITDSQELVKKYSGKARDYMFNEESGSPIKDMKRLIFYDYPQPEYEVRVGEPEVEPTLVDIEEPEKKYRYGVWSTSGGDNEQPAPEFPMPTPEQTNQSTESLKEKYAREREEYRQKNLQGQRQLQKGGLIKAQQGIFIDDPEEYKYRKAMYDDSLSLYQQSLKSQEWLKKQPVLRGGFYSGTSWDKHLASIPTSYKAAYNRLTKANKKEPKGKHISFDVTGITNGKDDLTPMYSGHAFIPVYKKPVQPVSQAPEIGTLPIRPLPQVQTPELVEGQKLAKPQRYQPIKTAKRMQTVMEPDPDRPGKYRVKDLRRVDYAAHFPGEGWESLDAPRVVWINEKGEEVTQDPRLNTLDLGNTTFQKGGQYYTFPGSEGVYRKVGDKWEVDWNRSGNFQPLSKGNVEEREARLDKGAKPFFDKDYSEMMEWKKQNFQSAPKPTPAKKPTAKQTAAQKAFDKDFQVTDKSKYEKIQNQAQKVIDETRKFAEERGLEFTKEDEDKIIADQFNYAGVYNPTTGAPIDPGVIRTPSKSTTYFNAPENLTFGDYAGKVWDVVTNPIDYFNYSVATGDMMNAPWDISDYERALEKAGEEDPILSRNAVGQALDFASYFNPVTGTLQAIKTAGEIPGLFSKAMQTGDWSDAGWAMGETALEMVPGMGAMDDATAMLKRFTDNLDYNIIAPTKNLWKDSGDAYTEFAKESAKYNLDQSELEDLFENIKTQKLEDFKTPEGKRRIQKWIDDNDLKISTDQINNQLLDQLEKEARKDVNKAVQKITLIGDISPANDVAKSFSQFISQKRAYADPSQYGYTSWDDVDIKDIATNRKLKEDFTASLMFDKLYASGKSAYIERAPTTDEFIKLYEDNFTYSKEAKNAEAMLNKYQTEITENYRNIYDLNNTVQSKFGIELKNVFIPQRQGESLEDWVERMSDQIINQNKLNLLDTEKEELKGLLVEAIENTTKINDLNLKASDLENQFPHKSARYQGVGSPTTSDLDPSSASSWNPDVYVGGHYSKPGSAPIIVEHEVGHGSELLIRPSSTNNTRLDRDLIENLTFVKKTPKHVRNLPTKEQIKRMRPEERNPLYDNRMKDPKAYVEDAKRYFVFGNTGTFGASAEPSAFLTEVRADMLKKGLISNRHDEITPELIQKHYKDYTENYNINANALRLYDIIEPTKQNFKYLAEKLKDLKVLVPAVPAAGAAYMGSQELGQHPGGKFQQGGIVLELTPQEIEQYRRQGYIIEEE